MDLWAVVRNAVLDAQQSCSIHQDSNLINVFYACSWGWTHSLGGGVSLSDESVSPFGMGREFDNRETGNDIQFMDQVLIIQSKLHRQ